MKINITIEATPEELREAMGLPDMKLFHEEALADVQKRLKTIHDPHELMKAILPISGAIGKTFWEEMAKNMSLLRIDLPETSEKKEEAEEKKKTKKSLPGKEDPSSGKTLKNTPKTDRKEV